MAARSISYSEPFSVIIADEKFTTEMWRWLLDEAVGLFFNRCMDAYTQEFFFSHAATAVEFRMRFA